MSGFLSSRYQITTHCDIPAFSWSLFQVEAHELLEHFDCSGHFSESIVVSKPTESGPYSVAISLRGMTVTLCRSSGVTDIKTTFEGIEDLVVRSLVVLYAHHGREHVEVSGSGSDDGWRVAEKIVMAATRRPAINFAGITVDPSLSDAAQRDVEVFSALYSGSESDAMVGPLVLDFEEIRWFF